MQKIKTYGYVLKKVPYQNEHRSLFSVFTSTHGKILLSARTGKRLMSETKVIKPFNVCELELYKSSSGHFKVSSVTLIDSFHPERITTKNNLKVIQELYLITEIIHTIFEEEQADSYMFDLLIHTCNKLISSEETLTSAIFKIQLLKKEGVLPSLKTCNKCEIKACDDNNFLLENELQLYCINCIKTYRDANDVTQKSLHVSFSTLKLLNFLASTNPKQVPSIKVTNKDIIEIHALLNVLLYQLLPFKLKSEQKSIA